MKKTLASIITSLGCFAVCAEPIRSNVSARDIINAYEEDGMVEVEYLESTGTQYIDTMWLPQANHFYEVFVDFQFTTTRNDMDVMGVRNSAGDIYVLTRYTFLRGFENRILANFDTLRHTYHYGEIIDGVREATYDGTVKYTCASVWPKSLTDRTFPIFGRKWFSNNVGYIGDVRIFSFYIKDNDGNFIIDFVPVRIGKVGYMYDRVNDILFENDGTGDFVIGPDKR